MLRLIFITALVAMTARGADDVAERCRVGLVFLVKEKRVLTPDALRAFVDAPAGTNPLKFATIPSDLERLPFDKFFTRSLKGPDAERVWRALHAEAQKLLESEGNDEVRRAAAADDTAALPIPVLRKAFDSRERPFGLPAVFMHEGKPFATFGLGRRAIMIVDLTTMQTRTEDLHAVFPIGGRPEYLASPGVIAYTGQKSTNGMSGQGLGFLHPEAGHVTPQILPPKDKIAVNAIDGLHAFEHDGKVWIVTIDNDGGQLAIVPIGGGSEKVERYAAELADVTPAVFSRAGSHPLIAVERRDGKGLRIIDPIAKTEQSLDPKIDFDELAFFALDGKPTLLLTGHEGAFTLDPTTKKAQPLPVPKGSVGFALPFESRGVPKTAVVVDNAVTIVNLKERTVAAPIPAPDIATAPRYLAAGGREYVVWGDKEGTITILDINRPEEIVRKRVARGGIREIVPFKTPRGVDALITRSDDVPYVAQLLGPVPKETP